MTIKKLISLINFRDVIHADATYKLNWKRFFIPVVGTTDKRKKFHPFGLHILSTKKTQDFEFMFRAIKFYFNFNIFDVNNNSIKSYSNDFMYITHLVADSSKAIHNAFKLVFDSATD